jgi:nucleotide-binding universal stress UspA family protein
MKILVAVDGSEISTRALKFALKLGKQLGDSTQLTIATVDPPLFPGAERKLGETAVRRYHDDNFAHMLGPARKLVKRAAFDVSEVTLVADIAPGLLKIAAKGRHGLLVMGSHGRGAVKGLVLGSISAKVLALSPVPVTIVR